MITDQEMFIFTSGVVVANAVEDNNNHEFVNRCDYGSLKDMPRAILSLLKNKTYICISIGAALDAFLLAGNITVSLKLHLISTFDEYILTAFIMKFFHIKIT